ncbi:MAG: RNA-guided endonuclease IscB [Xenococcaceae cyanobacterium MO_188.B32]|nr:RNA-guided endonuclease IscB [Xenococcaceae cyanobacterium MO_188.B32]
MSNSVFVLDTNKQPLTPCTSGMARSLLKAGKASVFRQYPFTIILKKAATKQEVKPCQLKLDPGSKITGIAILQENKLIWAAELAHRAQQIKNDLKSRRSLRRGRRDRKTRYRQPRFLNRTRGKGWLAPSLEHRVLTTMTWVRRLIKFCPISSIVMELVRFDTQKINNPEISGTEYQKGTLYQYKVREYLLEKFNRTCAYCGAKDTPLEVEHIKPKSKGGSNRVSNLTIACVPCNQAKSNLDIQVFLSDKPSVLNRILKQTLAPLKVRNAMPGKVLSSNGGRKLTRKPRQLPSSQENLTNAAAVNSTRTQLFNSLKRMGLPVTTGTGGQTKFNRTQQGLAKAHWLDAACVGDTPKLEIITNQPLLIKCSGHGKRQVIHVDKFGFPKLNKKGELVRKLALVKTVKGFETGDIVRAVVTKGKKVGSYLGKVAIRSSGSFNIKTVTETVQGISYKYCKQVHRQDGYVYGF